MKQVVVLGQSPTGLAAVRELAAAGYEVWGHDTRPLSVGLASRHVRRLPAGDDGGLLEAIARLQRPFVLPTTDHYVAWVIDHYAPLSACAVLSAGFGNGSARLLLDKEALHARCVEAGVDTPRTWDLPDRQALAEARAQGLRFPVALKPKLIHRWYRAMGRRKVLLADSLVELASQLDQLGGWGQFVTQEVIPGPEENIAICGLLCGPGGQILRSFTGIKLRQWPVGFGSACYARSEPLGPPLELSARILAHVGFEGVCGTEFKFDPRDRRYKLIEINPRPTLWFALTSASGVNLMSSAASEAKGDFGSDASSRQVYGVEWRYLAQDLLSLCARKLPCKTTRLLAGTGIHHVSETRSRVSPVFSCSDPRPSLAMGASLARAAVVRAVDWSRRIASRETRRRNGRPPAAVGEG